MSCRHTLLLAVILNLLFIAEAQATGPSFVPDRVVSGSDLASSRVVGQAEWHMRDGELVGTPQGGGWLVLDTSYQDVAFHAMVRCARRCGTGVLLRAESTAAGIASSLKGVYLSLSGGDVGAYRVTLGQDGEIVQRDRLPAATGMLRMAPVAGVNRPPGGGRGTGPAPSQPPAGIVLPHVAPSGELRDGQWNRIEIFLDANVVRWFVNDGPVAAAVAAEDVGRVGPLALHVEGSSDVQFKEVAYKDLSLKVVPPEEVSSRFRMQRLSDFFYSWSNATADFDRDGVLDVATGPYIYYGPDYTRSREVYVGHTYNPSSQYPYSPSRQYPELFPDSAWVVHARDFTGDGWPDVLTTDHASTPGAVLYVNPRGASRRWDRVAAIPRVQTEITLLRDVDGDGELELVYAAEGYIHYAEPDRSNPTAPWTIHAVSEQGPWGRGHGLGGGDINGDGRMDIVGAWGWWEQPVRGSTRQTWTYHPEAFGRWDRSLPGGGTIAVYDVNGDQRNDIVTALQAHGFGLAWFEQTRSADGAISFVQHMIMDDFSTANAGGVTFTQLHGATSADVDKDGVLDFIVGKRYWAHQDSYYDPDPYGAAVLYWYRTVRNPAVAGGAEFVPHLIHNRSGVGSDVLAADLNVDGEVDIVTTTNRGTFIFWGQGGGDTAERPARP